jgi:formylglycine-generating enzyme required for sulfatase activity
MVLVPGADSLGGTIGITAVEGPRDSYFIDRHEVTNRQFKQFVDQGGYQKREYWKTPFVRVGKPVSWEEAMAEFRDTTGRPGPSTVAPSPDRKDDFPVSGVSWYERPAYAAFAGRACQRSRIGTWRRYPHLAADPGQQFLPQGLASVAATRASDRSGTRHGGNAQNGPGTS